MTKRYVPWYFVSCLALYFLTSSCSMLDTEIPVMDAETGEQVGTTTVGDVLADSGEAAGDVAGGLVSAFTGNPILGGAAAAGLAGLFQAGRRRKKPVVTAEE